MEKKKAKLPLPKKLKLDEFDIKQTLGTGNGYLYLLIFLRIFRKSEARLGQENKKVLCVEDIEKI
jgi:hypothetical protein